MKWPLMITAAAFMGAATAGAAAAHGMVWIEGGSFVMGINDVPLRVITKN